VTIDAILGSEPIPRLVISAQIALREGLRRQARKSSALASSSRITGWDALRSHGKPAN